MEYAPVQDEVDKVLGYVCLRWNDMDEEDNSDVGGGAKLQYRADCV